MKKWFSLFLVAVMCFSVFALSACSKSKDGKPEAAPAEGAEQTEDKAAAGTGADSHGIDWENLEWTPTQVETLGSTSIRVEFAFPEDFGGYQEVEDDQSFISYGSSTTYGETEGIYSITAFYYKGEKGPHREDIIGANGESMDLEINGKQVLINKDIVGEKYIYTYFAEFSDPEDSRVVFVVTDAEEFGGFRRMFERKLWWA